MYPVGGPRDWPLASLTGPRGSPGPQTPGSQPACDTGRKRLSARLLWRLSGDFSDSDSEETREPDPAAPFSGLAFKIVSDMHMGEEYATAWGCDLTYDYVKINGDYRT